MDLRACSPTGGVPGAARMEWFIARNGKVEGPLTLEALVDAKRLGRLGQEDHVWEPGAEAWQPANDVAALWAASLEPPSLDRKRTIRSKRSAWLQGLVALIVSGSALLISFTIIGSIERKHPRPMKRDCSLEDYRQGWCPSARDGQVVEALPDALRSVGRADRDRRNFTRLGHALARQIAPRGQIGPEALRHAERQAD